MQQVQTLSPQQVLQVRLLEMPVSELEQRVKNELIDNGALEESLGSPEDADTSSEDVYDGTDAVMLSGETAQGKYPLEAVKMMAQVAETTEQHLDLHLLENAKLHSRRGISSAVSNAAVSTAASLNAKAIICPTMSGFTARLISKLKPAQTIIGASPNEDVLRKMQLYWGVRPLKTAQERSSDMIFQHAIDVAENAGYIEEGDTVVMTGGVATSPTSSRRGLTNMIRVQSV